MNERKTVILQVMLSYLFPNCEIQIFQELPQLFPTEQRVQFGVSCKPGIFTLYILTWNGNGDFMIWRVGDRNAQHPHVCLTSQWFRVGAYLRSNFASVKTHLQINFV